VPPEPALFRQPALALCVAAGLVTVAVVLTVVVSAERLPGVDETWMRWMLDARSAFLTDVARVLNVVGDTGTQVIVRLAVAAVLLTRRWWRRFGAFVVVALLTTPISELLKAAVARPRPPYQLVHAGGSAFPSGHALAAAVTSIAIVLAFTVRGRARAVGLVVAALYVMAMAWSRTELGVHWLTDVMAGALLGAGLTVGVFAGAALLPSTASAEVAAP